MLPTFYTQINPKNQPKLEGSLSVASWVLVFSSPLWSCPRFVFWRCLCFRRGSHCRQPPKSSPLPHVPPLGTIPPGETSLCSCRAPALPGQTADVVTPIFRHHQGGSHPKRRRWFSLCPSHPTPNIYHGGAGPSGATSAGPVLGLGVPQCTTPQQCRWELPQPAVPPVQKWHQHPRACQKILGELSHLGHMPWTTVGTSG